MTLHTARRTRWFDSAVCYRGYRLNFKGCVQKSQSQQIRTMRWGPWLYLYIYIYNILILEKSSFLQVPFCWILGSSLFLHLCHNLGCFTGEQRATSCGNSSPRTTRGPNPKVCIFIWEHGLIFVPPPSFFTRLFVCRVYSEMSQVINHLTHAGFELTENEEEADVIWSYNHIKDYRWGE